MADPVKFINHGGVNVNYNQLENGKESLTTFKVNGKTVYGAQMKTGVYAEWGEQKPQKGGETPTFFSYNVSTPYGTNETWDKLSPERTQYAKTEINGVNGGKVVGSRSADDVIDATGTENVVVDVRNGGSDEVRFRDQKAGEGYNTSSEWRNGSDGGLQLAETPLRQFKTDKDSKGNTVLTGDDDTAIVDTKNARAKVDGAGETAQDDLDGVFEEQGGHGESTTPVNNQGGQGTKEDADKNPNPVDVEPSIIPMPCESDSKGKSDETKPAEGIGGTAGYTGTASGTNTIPTNETIESNVTQYDPTTDNYVVVGKQKQQSTGPIKNK